MIQNEKSYSLQVQAFLLLRTVLKGAKTGTTPPGPKDAAKPAAKGKARAKAKADPARKRKQQETEDQQAPRGDESKRRRKRRGSTKWRPGVQWAWYLKQNLPLLNLVLQVL